jgi:glutathione synthase/RimK-type ligase-like ATP-grasp enzyme
MQFLIVTIADDLHGLSVQARLRQCGFECQIVESDRLTGIEALSFSIGRQDGPSTRVLTSGGQTVDISSVGVVWWRRPKALQQLDSSNLDANHVGLINNDCTGALIGSLQSAFAGKWISSPKATEFASNKLNQLTAARRCGFRIPDTLITQAPSEVMDFYQRHNGHVIVKPVVGTPGPLLFTQLVREDHLRATDSILACPATYQELIEGNRHIRLNCFGERSFACLIESAELDWRPNLKVPITRWPVPDELHQRVRRVLDELGLEMGIFDLKETLEGEIVWLEVNPQGQFLFLEGLTGEPLTEHFADYLINEMSRLQNGRQPNAPAIPPATR